MPVCCPACQPGRPGPLTTSERLPAALRSLSIYTRNPGPGGTLETCPPPWESRAPSAISPGPETLHRCLPEACSRIWRHCCLLKTIFKPNIALDLGPFFGHVGHFWGHSGELRCLHLQLSAQRFFVELRFIFIVPGSQVLLVFVGQIEDSRLCLLIALKIDFGPVLVPCWHPKSSQNEVFVGPHGLPNSCSYLRSWRDRFPAQHVPNMAAT